MDVLPPVHLYEVRAEVLRHLFVCVWPVPIGRDAVITSASAGPLESCKMRKWKQYALFPDLDPSVELLPQQVGLSKRSRYDMPAGAR